MSEQDKSARHDQESVDPRVARRVGWLVTAATVLLVLALVFMDGGNLLARRYTLHLYLPDASGLEVGSHVRLDGIDVGQVGAIRLNTRATEPSRSLEVELRIRRDVQELIREDSVGSLLTEGLIGTRVVTISRGFEGAPLLDRAELRWRAEPHIPPGRLLQLLEAAMEQLVEQEQQASDGDAASRKAMPKRESRTEN
jgi:ABC-type transporter Mla subunit MlaD